MLKKALSLFLSFVIAFSVFSITAVTANAEEKSTINTETMAEDVNISGTNSLGNMLTDVYSENVSEEDFIGNNIYEIEVESSTVYVDLQALTNAKLVVALYDESTQEMLCTGMKDIGTEDTVVQVDLDVDNMPQYFVIKAYMLDSETNVPLCKQFECDTYTWRMQEFLAKTTEDFEQDKVLALDESNDNNFLVYNDETVQIEGDENTNVVTVTDETTQKYVIENIDESISSLQVGDIFSHTYGDEENILIVKVSSITIDGTTATIYGEEVELEEAFDFIKIDASQGTGETTVDNSELEDGVEYLGIEDESTSKCPSSVGIPLVDQEMIKGFELKYEIDKEFGVCKVVGNVGCKLEASLKCYYDAKLFENDEVEFSFAIQTEISIGANVELSTNEDKNIKIKFGAIGFSPVPGVYIDFTPAIIFEGKANIELNGILSNQIGVKFKNGEWSDNSKEVNFHSEIKVSGELFFGFSLEPRIKIVGDIISASAELKTGIKISAEMEYSTENEIDAEENHTCISCIDGILTWHSEISFEIELLNSKDLKFTFPAFERDIKLCNFYYSFDTGKFALTSCPNHTYRQTITIANREKNNPALKDIYINGVKADENHTANLYLTKGTHEITVINLGIVMLKKTIDVSEAYEQTLYLEPRYRPNRYDSVVDDITPTITTTGQCGDDVYYTLYSDGTLEITGTGDMYGYSSSFGNPFDNLYIKNIKIQKGITSIGDYNFSSCDYLRSILIPDSVTSIGRGAFYICRQLTEITIPDSVTKIDDYTFWDCSNLESIVLSKNIPNIGERMFSDCNNLKNISIPDSVKSIDDHAFYDCNSLTNIEIPNSVITIGKYAFYDCNKLNIVIKNGVTSIGDCAFYRCGGLTELTIPMSVTSIGKDNFYECYKLESINVDTNNKMYCSIDGVLFDKNMHSLLQYPQNKKDLTYTIPNTVTSIGNLAFYINQNLNSITIPNNVTSIGDHAFYGTNITTITIPNSITDVGSSVFGNSKLTSAVFADGCTTIGDNMFSGCSNLTNITIPSSVTSIGETAFSDCNSLESININNNNKFYCSIDGVLFDKNVLNLITYPRKKSDINYIIPDTVTNIADNAFWGCTNLKSITIPDSLTNIGDYAFSGCKSLTSINIPYGVTDINYAFIGCTSLTNITIPNSVTNISGAFCDCSNLTSITIPSSVTSIGGSAFYNCSSLTSITIPSSVTTIGNEAFSSCTNLTSITIPNSVTTIGRGAFRNCINLTSITIPNSVTNIEYGAFKESPNLAHVYYNGSVEDWNKITIGYENDGLSRAIIHYGLSTKTNSSVIKHLTHKIQISQEEPTTPTKQYSRTNLVPNTEAVLMIVRGMADDYEINASTLRYIAQTTVDENGTATFNTYGDFADNSWSVVLIFGECTHSSSKWKTVKEATHTETGLEICICDHCGEVIDSNEIDVLAPEYPLGDVNSDMIVNIDDATQIQKYLVELISLDETQIKNADIDSDGIVSVRDATEIQKYLIGISSYLNNL